MFDTVQSTYSKSKRPIEIVGWFWVGCHSQYEKWHERRKTKSCECVHVIIVNYCVKIAALHVPHSSQRWFAPWHTAQTTIIIVIHNFEFGYLNFIWKKCTIWTFVQCKWKRWKREKERKKGNEGCMVNNENIENQQLRNAISLTSRWWFIQTVVLFFSCSPLFQFIFIEMPFSCYIGFFIWTFECWVY